MSKIKRLPPVKNLEVDRYPQENTLKETMRVLAESMHDLKEQFSTLSSSMHQEHNVEDRFISIKVNIPTIQRKDEEQLRRWLGELCRRVFSQGFQLFESGKLTQKRTKVFCSENMLYNVIQLVRKNKFKENELKLINQCLEEQMGYLLLKYPQSEEAETSMSLAGAITELDNFSNNENDLVWRSGIKFEYSEDGNYNREIMQFINYIINLPEKIVEMNEPQRKEQEALGNVFVQDMENFFKQIEDEEKVTRMRLFKKGGEIIHHDQKKDGEKGEMTKDQIKYAEKVKSYSKYLIGRKLSKNVQTFSQRQIEEENLDSNNSALMRILTKWCQQLEGNFKNVEDREEPFRTEDQRENYLSGWKLKTLSKFLAHEKQKINKYMKQFLMNNYEQQSSLSRDELLEKLAEFSEFESKVGLFSSLMFKNSKYYLIAYLNALIHGLLEAVENYAVYIERENFREKNIQQMIKIVQEKRKPHSNVRQSENKDQIPCLITFKVGDLLRCKCSSKEYQITSLYNQLQRIHHQQPELLKMVRVKNRLNKGTKDILINFMYRKSLLVEIQLAVNSDKSRFIECSDKFNHFIYQLKRSMLSPLSEMCNIWMNSDPRASFYSEKAQKLNSQTEKQVHECKGSRERQISFPFKCGLCSQYYSNIVELKKHRHCEECEKNICIPCKLMGIQTYAELEELIPELPDPGEKVEYEIMKPTKYDQAEIPDSGMVLNLRTKKVMVKQYKKIQKKGEIYLFSKKRKNTFEMLSKVSKKGSIKQFLRNNIILQGAKINSITQQDVKKWYFIMKVFESTRKKEKESIMINDYLLDDQVMEKLNNEHCTFATVKKINFCESGISNLQHVFKLFPNLQFAMFNESYSLSHIPDNCERLKNLSELYLVFLHIQTVSANIGKLKKLKVLDLRSQFLKTLPEEISELQSLQKLTISNTGIESLPVGLGACRNLKTVLIRGNRLLKSIPQSLENCENIETLDFFEQRQLKQFPQNLHKWKKLKSLNLSYTKVKELPESIGELSSLQKLQISRTLIKRIPESIGKCKKLTELKASSLEELCQGIGGCESLKELIIENSNLSKLPDSIGSCRKLQTFKLDKPFSSMKNLKKLEQKAKIHSFPYLVKLTNLKRFTFIQEDEVQLPGDIGKCQNLEYLQVKSNALPSSIGDCTKLTEINLPQYLAEELPSEIGLCKSLVILRLRKARIKNLSDSIESCSSLEELNLSGSSIQTLPDSLKLCKHLKKLNLTYTSCKLPQWIGSLKALEDLQLSGSQNESLPESIGSLQSLVTLNLNSSQILELPEQIGSLKKLTNLYLGQTKIQHLPESIGQLQSLSYINSQNSAIKSLPKSIGQCKSLMTINLKKCPIQELPEEIGKCEKLLSINLYGTKLKKNPTFLKNYEKLRLPNFEK